MAEVEEVGNGEGAGEKEGEEAAVARGEEGTAEMEAREGKVEREEGAEEFKDRGGRAEEVEERGREAEGEEEEATAEGELETILRRDCCCPAAEAAVLVGARRRGGPLARSLRGSVSVWCSPRRRASCFSSYSRSCWTANCFFFCSSISGEETLPLSDCRKACLPQLAQWGWPATVRMRPTVGPVKSQPHA